MLSLGGCFVFGGGFVVRFTKPPTTFDRQVELLMSRGMGGDPNEIRRCLSMTNYYRLSAYWFTFRREDATRTIRYDDFLPGTTFEVIWDRYRFDRRLRLLVMDAIERIEITLRTALSYWHAHEHGPFAYVDNPASLPKLTGKYLAEFIERVTEETERGKHNEDFAKHFQRKYGDSHAHLPLWMATEVMTFRTVLTLFQSCSHRVKKNVADVFGMPDSVFSSWLLTLNAVRNVCAHHGRLWNRTVIAPTIPTGKNYRIWNTPVLIKHDRMFAVLTMINYCVDKIASDDSWASRFNALFADHPHVPIKYMGFPDNWKTSPLWAGASGP
jgi:abortive infection bacteriophage resistance protein